MRDPEARIRRAPTTPQREGAPAVLLLHMCNTTRRVLLRGGAEQKIAKLKGKE